MYARRWHDPAGQWNIEFPFGFAPVFRQAAAGHALEETHVSYSAADCQHQASERSLADFIRARVSTKVHLNVVVQERSVS